MGEHDDYAPSDTAKIFSAAISTFSGLKIIEPLPGASTQFLNRLLAERGKAFNKLEAAADNRQQDNQ